MTTTTPTPRRAASSARRRFYMLFIPACFFVFAYPPLRLANWHFGAGALGAGAGVLIWLAAVAALWHAFRAPNMLVRYVAVHWMGVSFILFALTAAYEGLRLIASPDDRAAAVWIAGIAAALVVVALAAAQHLSVRRLALPTEKVTRRHRVVQISDVHIGSRRGGYLARIVRRINQLRPDFTVITGDLVDSSAVGRAQLAALRDLRSRALFTLGNHERYAEPDAILKMLRELGVEPLRQQCVRAGELQVAGIDDADAREQVADNLPETLRGAQPGRYTILLYHRPLGWEAAAARGVDLMLCGHTHNGQIFPFNFLVKRQFRRINGLYKNGGAHLYVSPGTGTWGPLMRLGSRNEITCIDILPQRGSGMSRGDGTP
ncbi:MAG: metallophosphoesterase [Gammaproteobacteria bacterium]|nr:metallophosphoesterase [Gammaproteobacteria bacterium]